MRRVVIDALGDLERCSIDRQRFADFIYALIQWFAVENVTCLMTMEVPEMFDVHRLTGHDVSNMSDNTILMGYTRDIEMTRTFRIIKARGSAHNSRLHKLEIGYDGAVIKPVK